MEIQSFDTAYPGSMVARKDGQYIDRADTTSLAGALLDAIKIQDCRIEDLEFTLSLARIELGNTSAAMKELLRWGAVT